MQNNRISIHLVTVIAVCILAFMLGILCYFMFENNESKDEVSLDTSSLNTYSQTNNLVSNSNSISNTIYNDNSNINVDTTNVQNNTVSTSNFITTSDTNSTSDLNVDSDSITTKSSSKSEPLSLNEWGLASIYSSGEYVDVATRVTNVMRGTLAAEEYKEFCENDSTIYKYEDAKEGMEWAIIEYEIDLTSFSSNIRANLDRKISGTGDNSSIKYNGTTYIVSTVNMSYDFNFGKIVTARFATQLPIGCTDYLIVLGSSSQTQAFFIGE
jgi:hypothetical protein